MGKEAPGSNHEVYGPAEERKTPLSDEEVANLRREFAESGAQIGKRRWEAAKAAGEDESSTDGDSTGSQSEAYAELGSYGPASPELINTTDRLDREAKDARDAAAFESARLAKEARMSRQGKVNDDGIAKVRQALGLPSKEADSIDGHSPDARRTLDEERIKGERARKKHQQELEAQAAREWPKDQLIQTPSQAVEVGKKLADEQAKAKQAEEARGIIADQAE